MPHYMLISHHPMDEAPPADITPEMIQAIIEKYNNWTERLQGSGRLVGVNKLQGEPGRNIRGFGASQSVTDGPYAETKEIIGGYWIISAENYDEAVDLTRDCPSLEFGARMEVREVEQF
jgi:hypothetical protein